MEYKALTSFCSPKLSMHIGEVKTIANDNIVKDLIKAGYIEEIKPANKANESKKRGAKNE